MMANNQSIDDSETRTIYDVFPYLVWKSIYNHIDSSKDLSSLGFASSTFYNEFLKDTKPIWTFDEIFIRIFKEFSQKEVMSWRLVCKGWNKVVSRFLDLPEQVAPKDSQIEFRPMWYRKLNPLSLRNDIEMLSQFLNDAVAVTDETQFQKNLLISRSLQIGVDPSSTVDVNMYWGLANDFVQVIGKDVWDIEICCANKQLIHELLEHVPNLKSLKITNVEVSSLDPTQDMTPIDHLPRLPNLKHLFLQVDELNTEMVAYAAANYLRQVYHLTIFIPALMDMGGKHFKQLVNLNKLEIMLDPQTTLQFLQTLAKLRQLEAPNLQYLRLRRNKDIAQTPFLVNIKILINGLFPESRPLFPHLRHFHTDYFISLNVSNLRNDKPLQDTLAVWNLRYLQMDYCYKLGLDFLQALPMLEELKIIKITKNQMETLKQRADLNILYALSKHDRKQKEKKQSNYEIRQLILVTAWEVSSSLDILTVSDLNSTAKPFKYTRGEYENAML